MKLALKGGRPVRKHPFPEWPVWNDAEREALLRVLQSGKWGSLHGKEVETFERELAEYQDARFAIAVTSGTTALEVALRTVGIKALDEVIIPAYTFVATATAVLSNGAIPRFADIDLNTFNLDAASVETLITERTRAIIPVHFSGRAADMDAIMRIARKHQLYVIEDAAQAIGAQWRGRGVGAIGNMGCLSFQSSKNITAGEGGMILTNDEELFKLARSYMNCGRVEGGLWYAHYHLGGNFRMTEFQAALLRAQLQRYPEHLKKRQQNMRFLDQRLAELPGITPLAADERITSHAGHLYIFRYQAQAFDYLERDTFVKALQAEGIPASPGYSLPLYEQPVFKNRSFGPFTHLLEQKIDYQDIHLPATHAACYREAVWLPQNVLLGSRDDMLDIVNAIEKVYEHRHELT